MDAVAHAIADPVRRAILEALGRQSLSAGEVAARFAISRPAISRHLRVLRECGLVIDRMEGRRRVYAIDPLPLDPLVRWISGLDSTSTWEQRLNALETEVQRAKRDRLRASSFVEETA